MVRVYAGSTGMCLYTDSPAERKQEKSFIQSFVTHGILLTLNRNSMKVAGVVTVERETDEPFVFVVNTQSDHPIREYYESVKHLCKNRDGWKLITGRSDTPFITHSQIDGHELEVNEGNLIQDHLTESTTTVSYHNDPESAVRNLIVSLEETSSELFGDGRIVVTNNQGEELSGNLNHRLIVGQEKVKNASNDPNFRIKNTLHRLKSIFY